MATKILAHPTDDKRKASVVTIAVDSVDNPAGTTSDVVDIRGFANFTLVVAAAITSSAIVVSASADGPFYALTVLGSSTADPVTNIDAAGAYDIPELAGCHYMALNGLDTAVTVQLMGKV
jgi:hypothetical protein